MYISFIRKKAGDATIVQVLLQINCDLITFFGVRALKNNVGRVKHWPDAETETNVLKCLWVCMLKREWMIVRVSGRNMEGGQ